MKKILMLCLLLFFCMSGILYAGPTTTSGDTASDVITRVRSHLNEATADFWSDAELLIYINEAGKETVNRTRSLESGVSNIIVIENTRSYSIPETISGVSFGGVAKIEYDIGLSGNTIDQTQVYDLERVPFMMLRKANEKEVGNPKVFSVWANTLYVWPIPRSDQSGNTLYLYNLVAPSGVTATASPIETPSGLDSAIDIYVRARAMFKWHENPELFDKDLALWREKCDWYVVNVMRRELPIR